jgi:hypothetical protein
MRVSILIPAALLVMAVPAQAQLAVELIPPVDAGVSRPFDEPKSAFGPGHRGIDYAATAGTRVRSAAEGTVLFAGRVPGGFAISVEHLGGLVTTYSRLSTIEVKAGDRVAAGAWIGTVGTAHQGEPGLHFGAKIDGRYVDPASLMTAIDISDAVHLAPLVWTPRDMGGLERVLAPTSAGTAEPACNEDTAVPAISQAPNDNFVVEVAGITSKTKGGTDATLYEEGAEALGYPANRVYRFSYRGSDGRRFHVPYSRSDTYGDLRIAAARLQSMMVALHQAHPDAHVDLIAHSQGGIVSRLYLESHAGEWNGALPQVDHFVTLSTPHSGAPLAGEVDELAGGSLTGGLLLRGAAALSRRGLPVPDPTGRAVTQLAPDSELIGDLAREDVTFGTRSLALAIPNDPVVPADHAGFYGANFRVVSPRGGPFAGHSAIVSSPEARSIAYEFLADRALTCDARSDRGGLPPGALWSAVESGLGEAYRATERAVVTRLAGLAVTRPVAAFLYDNAAPGRRHP